MSGILEGFLEGEPFMWMILSVSVVAMGIVAQRAFLFYVKYRLAEDDVTRMVIQSIEANNYSRALQICQAKAHPLTNILKAGVMRANRSEKEIRRSMEIATSDEVSKIKKGIATLPHLSNVATLLGLLGTIRGLIIAFTGMESGDAVKRQEALSKGIALAFRATFFALFCAVIMILCFVVLSGKQNKLLAKIEYSGNLLIDTLISKAKKVGEKG